MNAKESATLIAARALRVPYFADRKACDGGTLTASEWDVYNARLLTLARTHTPKES